MLDVSADVGLYRAVFEHAVAGPVEGAVLEHQVLRIAQQLFARQVAVHQSNVLRVPRQILTVQLGVVDGYVLTLPERVLGQDTGMVDLHVLTVLEHVFRIALQSVDVDVLGEHERVGASVQLHVVELQTVDLPECLVGVAYLHILQFHVVHLAEELRTVDAATAHHEVVGIPDSRA